jgi:hypothetical protein
MKPTPRLALSVTSKPSFIFKRIESLMQWGKDPFHPRRGQLAGVAVCLGIVAVMVALFGQPMRSSQEPKDWKQKAIDVYQRDGLSGRNLYAIKHPNPVLTDPMFYMDGQFIWKHKETKLFGSMQYGSNAKISVFFLDHYGLFMFSLEPFSDSKRVGKIEGKNLTVQIDGLDLRIESMYDMLIEPIFYGKTVPVYVKHDGNYSFEKFRSEILEYKSDAHFEPSMYETNMPLFDEPQYWGRTDVTHVSDLYRIERKPNLAFKYPKIRRGNESWRLEEMNLLDDCYQYDDKDQYVFYHSPIGMFIFSFLPFEDAKQTAVVEGNLLKVPTPKGEVIIESEKPILNHGDGKIWFKYEDVYSTNPPPTLINKWHHLAPSCPEN